MDFERGIARYRQVEAKIKEIDDEYEAKVRPFKDLKAKLKLAMLAGLNEAKQDSAKTALGTVHTIERASTSLEDPEAFKRHVIGTESWDLLDWKANLTATKDFAEANSTLPPGVKLNVMVDVGVRAPSKVSASKKAGAIMAVVAAAHADGGEPTEEQQEEIDDRIKDYEATVAA